MYKVLDVGGHHNTYEKATHIIDMREKHVDCKLNYTQMDICSTKWPFKDNEFDFVWCAQTLEDVKDPVRVCKEMMRVGKAGKIIFPSALTECTIGVDAHIKRKKYAGYVHHRWLCFPMDKGIKFVLKTPITHIFDWTSHISQEEKRKRFCLILNWVKSFEAVELLLPEWQDMYDILKNEFEIDPLKEYKKEWEDKRKCQNYSG